MNFIKKYSNLVIRAIKSAIEQIVQKRKSQAHAHRKVFNWEWHKKGFNRISVVNHLISVSGGLDAK